MMLLACGRPLAGSWRATEALRRVSMAEKSEFRDRDAFPVVAAMNCLKLTHEEFRNK